MRSTIDINPKLLKKAMSLTKAKTKKELINLSLEELLRSMYRKRLKCKLGNFPLDLSLRKLNKIRKNE